MTVTVNGVAIRVDVPEFLPPFYRIVINDTWTEAWIEAAHPAKPIHDALPDDTE